MTIKEERPIVMRLGSCSKEKFFQHKKTPVPSARGFLFVENLLFSRQLEIFHEFGRVDPFAEVFVVQQLLVERNSRFNTFYDKLVQSAL